MKDQLNYNLKKIIVDFQRKFNYAARSTSDRIVSINDVAAALYFAAYYDIRNSVVKSLCEELAEHEGMKEFM